MSLDFNRHKANFMRLHKPETSEKLIFQDDLRT